MISGIFEKKKEEKKFFIKANDVGDTITVFIVDENEKETERGHLLAIDKTTGRTDRAINISPIYGFDLDSRGSLKVE